MICERGRVVAVEGDGLWVETVQQSSCASCSAQKGCGQGLMNSLHDGKRNQIKVACSSHQHFNIGDEVDIAIPESALLGGAFLMYLLPLFTMLAGMGVFSRYFAADGMAALGAALGLAAGLVGVRAHSLFSSSVSRYTPTVLGLRGAGASTGAEQVVQVVEPSSPR